MHRIRSSITVLTIIISILAVQSGAAEEVISNIPLSFKTWKELQIVDAQNRSARISNRLTLLKAGNLKAKDVAEEISNDESLESKEEIAMASDSSRIQKLGPKDLLARLEKEQERASKTLEYAKEMGIEVYLLVYLSQFHDSPEALASVANRLSKEEVTQLLKTLIDGSSKTLTDSATRQKRSGTNLIEAREQASKL